MYYPTPPFSQAYNYQTHTWLREKYQIISIRVDTGAMHESSLTSPTYNLANAAPSESGQMLSVYTWIFLYVYRPLACIAYRSNLFVGYSNSCDH